MYDPFILGFWAGLILGMPLGGLVVGTLAIGAYENLQKKFYSATVVGRNRSQTL